MNNIVERGITDSRLETPEEVSARLGRRRLLFSGVGVASLGGFIVNGIGAVDANNRSKSGSQESKENASGELLLRFFLEFPILAVALYGLSKVGELSNKIDEIRN